MKKYNSVNESQGLIDKDGIQWNDLSDLITEYVYDLQHGLNADPFYNGNEAHIKNGTIESYYQYKHSKKMPNYIIPNWIGTFDITILETNTKGRFLQTLAKLDNNKKLNFIIEINSNIDEPNLLCNTLVHEFQHAYSTWLQLTKNFKFYNNKQFKLYKQSTTAFHDKSYDSLEAIAKQSFIDYIDIKDEVFENPKYLEKTLLTSFYYASEDESRSFIQEFAIDIIHKIKDNHDVIVNEIKESLKFKENFNEISSENKFKSNILNNLSISCYDSYYYKVYKIYYNFYKRLLNTYIDEDVASEVISNTGKTIKLYLNILSAKKLINFSGDENKILKQIAKKQILFYEKVLKKMQKIYVKIILELIQYLQSYEI